MISPRKLIDKVNWEPVRELYYEVETFFLFHPERIKSLIESYGAKPKEPCAPQPGRLALVKRTQLAAESLTDLVVKTSELLVKACEVGAGVVILTTGANEVLLQLAPLATRRVTRLIMDSFEAFWGSLARKYQLWIIVGTRTLQSRAHKRELCYCFDPAGKCSYQFKTHLSAGEIQDGYLPGRQVKVFNTGAGPLALAFAGEEQFFELARIQAARGAKIVVRLGEWPQELEITTLSGEWARAQENNFYYISGKRIYSPTYLSIDGSGVFVVAETDDLPFIQIDVNLARLAQCGEDPGAVPAVNREIMTGYLPNLYRQLWNL